MTKHFEVDFTNMSTLVSFQGYLTRYGMTTYLILGNFGNLFNIMIFCQLSHRKNSCSLYLLMASIMNIFTLNFGIIPTLYSLDYPNPELTSIVFCKLRLYLLHSSLMISRSMIVLACIDRFAVSSCSKYLHRFGRPKIAIYLIIFFTCFWPISASHILVLLTIKFQRCTAFGKYSLIYSIYSFLVAGVLPPTLMIIFGCLTIRNLRHIHARIRPNIIRFDHNHRKDYYLTVMLICEVCIYFISTLPYPIQTLYLTVTRNTVKTVDRLEIEGFLTFLAYSFLIYINSASTFYIYLCTSRAFRRQCRRLLKRYWKRIICSTNERQTLEYRYSPSRRQQHTTFV